MLIISPSLIALFLLLFSLFAQASVWTAQELRILNSFKLTKLPANPNHASNLFAYNQKAADFGKQLFFDKRFSLDGSFACASCHQPDKAFTDGLKKAKGVHKTGRNTQSILGAAHQDWFYWDGRKDSLWSQALVPFEAADEMASSRVQILRIIGQDKTYRLQYESLFGKFPDVIFNATIKSNAGPWGDSETQDNWYRIPVNLQKIINRAYANIGKSIAAYERSIPLPTTKFDTFLSLLSTKGESTANALLNQNQIAGLKLFMNQSKTHCLRCHNGPLLTNGAFHNIGTGNFTGEQLDFGRFLGIQAVKQDVFNCLGEYSDTQPEQCSALRFLSNQIEDETQGAYKTPSLRYLNKTAPYFHDGRFDSIQQVIDHYLAIKNNQTELPALSLTPLEKKQLIEFIRLLDSP
jgi:cytochrome c peroxidase